MRFFLILIISLLLVVSCQIDTYNIKMPDEKIILPNVLHEISGITMIDDSSIACVQDENGILYIYDLIKKKITKKYTFADDGDYEGITRVNNTIYVLKSDAVIFEIPNFDSNPSKTIIHETGIEAKNNEGLCYDKQNNRLLIGAKGRVEKDKKIKNKREIYAFDLKNKETKLVYQFDVKDIEEFAIQNDIKLQGSKKNNKKKKKNNKDAEKPLLQLRKSAIAIHPITSDLYVLSAVEYLLYIFNSTGNIKDIITLDKNLFNQSEGITFLNNGDMLISNEGQRKNPTLLRFNYKK